MPAPLDSVLALKLETPAGGGTQFDAVPTEVNPLQDALSAAGVHLQDSAATTVDKAVVVDRTGGNLRLTDKLTSHVLGELVSLTPGQVGSHNALVDVIHFLDGDGPGDGWASGAYNALSYTGALLTSSVWFTGPDASKRIVAYLYSYAGPLLTQAQVLLYAKDGVTVARTLTDTFGYAGPLPTSRTRTWS